MRPLITAQSIGWCYLLHMSRPLGNLSNVRAQAQHYSGWADDPAGDGAGLERRIAEHLAGRGAKITQAAVAAGIAIELVACWRAPLAFEKQLKRRKDAPRLCPVCCRARGRKVKHLVAAEQLALPLFESEAAIEPWPEGFEFPPPQLLRPQWAEIQAEIEARRASVALVSGDDWDEGLL
jgi:hypothetical protein